MVSLIMIRPLKGKLLSTLQPEILNLEYLTFNNEPLLHLLRTPTGYCRLQFLNMMHLFKTPSARISTEKIGLHVTTQRGVGKRRCGGRYRNELKIGTSVLSLSWNSHWSSSSSGGSRDVSQTLSSYHPSYYTLKDPAPLMIDAACDPF